MTHAEYEKKRRKLIKGYLCLASERQSTPDDCTELARQLARWLDHLALEIDPFENINPNKKETR